VAPAHETQALLAFMQLAIARTHIALDTAIIKDAPVSGGKEVGSDSRVQGGFGGCAHNGLVVKGSGFMLNPADAAASGKILLVDLTRDGRI